jgi:hypothetical protein
VLVMRLNVLRMSGGRATAIRASGHERRKFSVARRRDEAVECGRLEIGSHLPHRPAFPGVPSKVENVSDDFLFSSQ